MHKLLIALLFLILSNNLLNSQTVTEKEIFTLAYNGNADPYSFIYDKFLIKMSDVEYKIMNIKMIELSEIIVSKYDRLTL